MHSVVVPGYYLVCYNQPDQELDMIDVVVPGYYLVCYNFSFSSHGLQRL